MNSIRSFFHSLISAFIGRIGKFVGFVGFHWWKVVAVVIVLEVIGGALWWFKPKPPAFLSSLLTQGKGVIARLATPRRAPTTFSFTSAPRASGFALLSDNTKSGGFRALIGKKDAAGTPEARFEVDKSWMEFALAGGTDVRNFEKKKEKGQDSIIWKNVLTDTDVRYQIVDNGLKEDIILKSDFLAQRAIDDKDKVTIAFDLTTFNVLPRNDTSGKLGLAFMDAMTGAYQFHIEKPYLMDAAGKRFDAVAYKLEPTATAMIIERSLAHENRLLDAIIPRAQAAGPANAAVKGNTWRLTMTLPKDWLADKNRAYPVILDPTVTHNTQSAFANGYLNRAKDEGAADNAPVLTSSYHELAKDINTVGLWHMNEASGNATDSSGNGLTAIATGTTIVSSQTDLGNARNFSGSANNYLQVTNSTLLNFGTGAYTIEFWAKPTNTTNFEYFISLRNGSTAVEGLAVQASDKKMYLFSGTVWLDYALQSTWHHYALVRSGTGTNQTHFYVDGVSKATGTSTTNITGITNMLIGTYNGTDYNQTGILDELKISNIARTPEEIKQDAQRFPYSIFTSPVMDLTQSTAWNSMTWLGKGIRTGDGETPISTTNLVAQWNFNETSGTAAVSGGSCSTTCNGTLTGMTTSGQDAAANTGWTANNKRWGAGALMFDGSNDYVNVTASTNYDLNTYTAESWVKTSYTGATSQKIFYKGNASSVEPISMYLNSSGNLVCEYYNSGTNYVAVGTSDLRNGQWHHTTCVRISGTGMYAYVDGVLQKTGSDAGQNVTIANAAVISSRNGSDSFFNGVIDSVRLYSRALTAAEVLANYQAGNIELQTRTSADNATWEAWKPTTGETALDAMDILSPVQKISQANLVGYWKLNEVSGNRADSAGSNTLTDNATVTSKAGHLNLAGQFTAANSEYLSIADNAALSVPADQSFTFSLWVNPDSVESDKGVISKRQAGGSIEYDLLEVGGKFRAGVYGTGGGTVLAATAYNISTWYHIVWGYNADTDLIFMYINNDSGVTAASGSGSKDGTDPFWIGGYESTSYTFNGKIDEVAMWKRVLTADERRILYEDGLDKTNDSVVGGINRTIDSTTKFEGTGSEKLTIGAPQVDGNTVALWHMDETSGSGAYIKDATANANNGTPTGTTVVDGFYGKARSFNGTSDYVEASSYTVTAYPKTFEFWFNAKDTSDWRPFIREQNGSLIRQTSGANTLDIWSYLTTSASSGYYATPTSAYSLNTWNHVAVVLTSNTAGTLYLNGKAETLSFSGPVGSTSAVNGIDIGRGDGRFFKGSIDEVRISNTARSAEEIAEAYRAGRDHRISKTISSTDLSAKTKLPFYVASDRPGTFMEATIGESAYANYEPDANTKLLIHGDELTNTSTIKDSSGTKSISNIGTPVTKSTAKIGNSVYFDGSSTLTAGVAGDTASGGDFDPNVDHTIDFWVRPNSAALNNDIVFSTLANGSWTPGINIFFQNNHLYYYSNNGAIFSSGPGTETYLADTWYHITFVRSGNTINYYRNGQLFETVTSSGTISTANPFVVAGKTGGIDAGWGRFSGYLDEVRYSKIARTADEIRQAYEIGRRTHPITIDFVTNPQAAYSSGTSVTINNPYGTTALTNTLSVGDTIIFKENVNGTETIGQAVVSTITNTSTVYGTVTLASAPSFPSGGYTTNATVFKWQREYFDLTGSLTTHRDAVTRLTYRVTDGSQGANVWLDDIRSSGGYLTDNTPDSFNTTTGEGTYSVTGASIGSTLNRYFQYRAIMSSWDTPVSPQFTSATLDYASNAAPAAPTVSAPTNAATDQKFRPVLTLATTDADGDYLRYKIQIATDNGFSTNLQTFDETASQTGWSGQNASSSTAYSSGSAASYTIQSVLSTGTTYYVRAYAKDPVGSDTWSSASTTTSFTVVDIPTAAAATSVEISSFTMNWSGPATYTSYRLDVSTASDFSSYVTNFQNKTVNGTSDSLTGLNLATGATYYYRVRGADSNGDTSANSATITARLGICNPNTSGAFTATSSCRFENTYDGVQEGNFSISAGKTITINAGQRIAWTPGNSITINPGSSIAIANGAQLIQGYVVYPDADGDLYAASTTATVSAQTVPSNYTKRALVKTLAFTDRNDSNTAAYESRPLMDSAGNYGGWSGSDSNASTLSTDSSTTYLSSMGAMQAVMTSVNTGAGEDSSLSVTSGTTTINTTVSGALAGTATATTATVTSTTGFSVGNEVLLIQVTGTGAGNNEFRTISAVNSGTQVTFGSALTSTYTNDGSSKAQMIKVPHYTTVSVSAGATLTAAAWNGTTGGVLVFRASGTLTNGGTITMSGKGFTAGTNGSGSGGGGNRTCGCTPGISPWYSGGPGCGSTGGSGSAASGLGNGGGGGASGGGGGGGYGAAGSASSGAAGSSYGQSTLSSLYLGSGGGGGGTGGCGGGVWCGNCGGDGTQVSASGGWGGSGGNGAAGGIGGGIIFISTPTLQNNSVISSNGGAGTAGSNGGGGGTAGGWDSNMPCNWSGTGGNAGNGGGGGGGGSGGSILIKASTTTIGTIQASGGTAGGGSSGASGGGGSGCDGAAGSGSSGGGAGGAGAVGRIRIDNTAGNATASTPTAYSATLPSPQNVTLNRTLSSPRDLSGINHISFWVNSEVTGSALRFQMGEAAATEQTFDFTVSAANTWEEKSWDISAISAASRNAIQYMQFKYLTGTAGTFRIDGLTYYE